MLTKMVIPRIDPCYLSLKEKALGYAQFCNEFELLIGFNNHRGLYICLSSVMELIYEIKKPIQSTTNVTVKT